MEQKFEEMGKCFTRFLGIWNERVNAPPQPDLISMLAHGEATRNMAPTEFFGNVSLLIVGGNDTTRNSISASVHALSQFPDQEAKLRANPDLIPGMVSETIRWHTPVAHMKRTATCDAELGGQKIKQGDRVVMWYVSGNRDEREIPEADKFQIDRPNVRHHMAFGFGIHRCVGNRLAELQLKIVWEEILKRFPRIEALSEPVRAENIFLRSIEHLDVLIPERY
jgi:cytochrome P450